MTRYKGKPSAKSVEQNFSHIVEIVVPPGGLAKQLDAMFEFHTRHGIKPHRGQWRHDDRGSVIRWCFTDPVVATTFASEFKE